MATLSLTASTADYQTYRHDFARGEQDYNPATVHKFVAEMKRQGMLLNEFSWDDWYQNSHMVDRPEYIADASLYECRLLLSAMVRLERFSPGVLQNMRRQGVMLALLQRMQQLQKAA
ncbi:DUF6508 domain-containing protein [Shewanella algae]|uniref:DUF6508 domain-containing protein n=1 Tax=Shewanella algae TaxID=38313 RepID=UPI0031F4D3E7